MILCLLLYLACCDNLSLSLLLLLLYVFESRWIALSRVLEGSLAGALLLLILCSWRSASGRNCSWLVDTEQLGCSGLRVGLRIGLVMTLCMVVASWLRRVIFCCSCTSGVRRIFPTIPIQDEAMPYPGGVYA